MPSFNQIVLVGNLTKDVALSYLPSQIPVADLSMAMNRKWKDKEGQDKEEVCFIDCRAFGKSAETLNKYVAKGHLLLVTGRLSFEQWTAKDGSKKSRHRVIVESFQFLQSKPKGEASEQEAAKPQGEEEAFN